MTSKQFRQVDQIRNVICNLRLSLDKNDIARQYLFEAEQSLEKMINTTVPTGSK